MNRKLRHKRIRSKIQGTQKKPRLCVFRSNQYIYAQLIDDEKGKTLASASTKNLEKIDSLAKNIIKNQDLYSKKLQVAFRVGQLLAKKALKNKIKAIAFDRNGYKYHGRVKALADGARESGLVF